MTQARPTVPAVFALSGLALIERFTYYGFRAIIVLYALDYLNLDPGVALESYTTISLLVGLAAFPMGILTDALLGQKTALRMAAILLTIGYGIFAFVPGQYMGLSLLFIGLGTGLTRPSIPVLLGRLYPKQDRTRDIAFVLLMLAINTGAAVASFVVGLTAEQYSYELAFKLLALVSLLFLAGSFTIARVLSDNEYDLWPASTNPSLITRALILMAVMIAFWGIYEWANSYLAPLLETQAEIEGYPRSVYPAISTALTIGFLIISGLVWYFVRNPTSLTKLLLGACIGAAAFLMVGLFIQFKNIEPSGFFRQFTLYSIAIAVSEALLGPIVQSYLTRLSPKALSSSIIGLFFALSFLGNRIFGFLTDSYSFKSLTWPMIILSMGLIIGLGYLWKRYHKNELSIE